MTDTSRDPGRRTALERERENRSLRSEVERLREENGELSEDVARLSERVEALSARASGLSADLERVEHTDELTGLANRRALEEALVRDLARAARGGRSTVALLVGVDGTSGINGSLGHAAGDVVLRGVASRVRAAMHPGDSLCRIGGDEFLAILAGTDPDEGQQRAELVRRAIADHPLETLGSPLAITATVAVASVHATTVSIEEVLDALRASLAQGKRSGGDRVVRAGDAGDADGQRGGSAARVDDLDAVLARGGLRVFAQSIRSLDTGAEAGYELLIRGPEGTYESPLDLFRLAKERGALTRLDLACFRACVEASVALAPGLDVYVNLLPATLLDVSVERVLARLAAAGGPERFCIELSEQQFLGVPDDLVLPVQELKRAGVRVALDDVGAGRSSLEALVALEPDVVKIAREYVRSCDRFAARRRGLERIARAAGTLAGELVAEGIETEAERRRCAALGIPRGQGFLWDRPRSLARVAAEPRRRTRRA